MQLTKDWLTTQFCCYFHFSCSSIISIYSIFKFITLLILNWFLIFFFITLVLNTFYSALIWKYFSFLKLICNLILTFFFNNSCSLRCITFEVSFARGLCMHLGEVFLYNSHFQMLMLTIVIVIILSKHITSLAWRPVSFF